MISRKLSTLGLLSCAAVFSMSAMADTNPYAKPDEAWISISGTVDAVTADAFMLDYGEGIITVEMDDGDRDADGYKLIKGDKVTVSGRIDADLFETTTIEAGNVYVENIGTNFTASVADDEGYLENTWVTITTPVDISYTVLRGSVTEVNDESFTINTGDMMMQVEVDEMAYNPLDDEGYQKVETGDYVEVSGYIDNRLFGDRVFDARSLIVLVGG